VRPKKWVVEKTKRNGRGKKKAEGCPGVNLLGGVNGDKKGGHIEGGADWGHHQTSPTNQSRGEGEILINRV